MKFDRRRLSDWLIDRLWRGLVWSAKLLPYGTRVSAMGWLFRTLIGPLSARKAQALRNLEFVYPQMNRAERERITKAVLDNIGRTAIESYCTEEVMERAKSWQPKGAGWEPIRKARAEGRPILFIAAHFGNYQAARATLNGRGFEIAALYRPLNNEFLNEHYVGTLSDMGGGAYTRDRRGLAGFMRHLKSGAQAAILTDQYVYGGKVLDFMGQPAPTSLAAAEMALKFNALLVPVYSIREENGLDFRIELEAPIPHSDPETMTQLCNDSLGRIVEAYPEQWFWVHNRWKPERADQALLEQT